MYLFTFQNTGHKWFTKYLLTNTSDSHHDTAHLCNKLKERNKMTSKRTETTQSKDATCNLARQVAPPLRFPINNFNLLTTA